MTDLSNPHDKFFKVTLSQPGAAEAFLRHFLPADVTALLDLDHLQPITASFVDATLQEHFSDLLFEVPLHGGAAPIFVCILFEHKSYVDRLTALQVLRYMVHGWDTMQRQRRRLAPMLPIVVYHGTDRWNVATDFQGLFELPTALQPYTPTFHYHLSDLSAYHDDELKATARVGVGLLALKYILRPELRERLPAVTALWYSLHEQPSGLDYLQALLRYIVAAGKHVTLQDVLEATISTIPLGGALMSTIAEELIEQGKQQGEQLGLQKGLQQGEQLGLQRGLQQGEQLGLQKGLQQGIRLALKLKFGPDGEALLGAITAIEDVALLQSLADAIEDAASAEVLQAWLVRATSNLG
jgi:predicted transposase/invertase (TIGR01784 family)